MRAFSRIPSTGGGSAGQGYVAGQSNRLTSATYFDANGVMRVAPPKALRPNYVYKNGVWVRDGWLREGQTRNILKDIGLVGLTLPVADEELLTGVPTYVWESTATSQQTIRIDGGLSPVNQTDTLTQTIYVKPISGPGVIRLQRPWYWGPSSDFNFANLTSSLNGMFIHGPYKGGWFRIGGWGITPTVPADQWARLQATGPFKFLITCNQIEQPATTVAGTTLIDGTSWVSYNSTRAAD